MEVSGEGNEVYEFCTGAGGSPDAVVDVVEKELGDGGSVRLDCLT